MAILITGGAGYIGSHTVIALIEAGYEPIIVDNFSNAHPNVIHRLEEITHRPINYYKEDIRNQAGMTAIFEENTIEAVIHFAAYKAVGESVKKPLKYYDNNVIGTIRLLEVMQAHQVKRLVFSSSATVYGMDHPSPLDESLPVGKANNPYGYTKIVMEQILTDLATADPEWQITFLRYFNPIGAHPSGMIGEDPQGVPNNLMPYITQVAIGKRPYLCVLGDDYPTPDGTGIRDYIHVVDLAEGHVKALQVIDKQKGIAIYNLGRGQGCSVLELVNTFMKINQVAIPYEIHGRRSGDVAVCFADVAKAEKELNWEAKHDIESMCQDAWHWQSMNPQGYE